MGFFLSMLGTGRPWPFATLGPSALGEGNSKPITYHPEILFGLMINVQTIISQ